MGAMVLNWFVESEEVFMLQMVSPLILKLSLFLVTAVATHLVMSFGQTFLHYKVAHNPIGGKLFRYHINFHHIPLCRRSSCLSDVPWRRRQHYTLFPYSGISSRGVRLFLIAAKSFCGHGNHKRGVVLRACLFRQGISRRGIAASKVCVVQTPAGTALCSSPSRE